MKVLEFSNISLEHTPDPNHPHFMKEFIAFGALGMPGVFSRGVAN